MPPSLALRAAPAAEDPALESLLTGTLALMTGVAERCALGHPPGCHAQCRLMLGKLRLQLDQLCGHPGLSPGFRMSLARIRGHWQRLASEATLAADLPPAAQAAQAAPAAVA